MRPLPMPTMKRIVIAFTLIAGCAAPGVAKDVTVDAAGGGDFKSVQAAVDSVPDRNSEPTRLLIKPGKYEEYISVPRNKPFISFVGQGAKPEDTVLTYHLKALDPKSDGSG